jgi:hypothetical protein
VANKKLKFSGMNNRASPEAIPKNKDRSYVDRLRNAANVIFDNDDNIIFPRPGKTLRYSGDCHSIYQGSDITLFAESGGLKKLNTDNTATTLASGLGGSRVFYTPVGDTIYWANDITSGKVRNGVASEWGTVRPPRQADCAAISFGNMFPGDYRVAITWIADEESGTGMGRRVAIPDGGGIRIDNFPAPPSYVTGVAVYVSSVNGGDMYLYGEYPANVSEVTVVKHIGTIPLETQFKYPPMPQSGIIAHLGRIYYIRGNKVYWTEAHRYGLQKANSYWTFDSEVKVVVSTLPVLYVGTETRSYGITNIDSPDGSPANIEPYQITAAVKGSETYDKDGKSAYFMTDNGFVRATKEGLVELTYDNVAMPNFEEGTMAVTEINGLKYLVGAFQNGTQNPLANSEYNISEAARGSL